MPSVAVTSVKFGVTVSPPDTAWSSVTVKVSEPPSPAVASETVTAASAPSSFVIVPVAVSVDVTSVEVPDTARPTVNVSWCSLAVSSVVETVKLWVSPAVPTNVSAVVFSV